MLKTPLLRGALVVFGVFAYGCTPDSETPPATRTASQALGPILNPIEQPYLTGTTVPDAARLANGVALNGDVLYAGAPKSGTGGAVYRFERSAPDQPFVEASVLSTPLASADYGAVVVGQDDLLVVGAPADAADTGRVEILDLETNVLIQTLNGQAAGERFGASIAISNNLAFVGAPNRLGATAPAGGVDIFDKDLGGVSNWGQLASVESSDLVDGDEFGASISGFSEVLAVGAPMADAGGVDQGAVYIFLRDAGGADNWGELKTLVSPTAEDGSRFGHAVAVFEDLIFVGQPLHDGNASDTGRVHVFQRDMGGADNFGHLETLTAIGVRDDSQFGSAIVVNEDRMVVGAPGHSGGNGIAYLFEPTAEGWRNNFILDHGSASEQGFSAAISGDDIIVGSPTKVGTGAMIHFRLLDGPRLQDATFQTQEDTPLTLPLNITPDGAYTCSYVSSPSIGRMSGTYPNIVYGPDRDLYGTDRLAIQCVGASGVPSNIVWIDGEVFPVNDPPVFVNPTPAVDSDQVVYINQMIRFQLAGSDVEGDSLSFSLNPLPAGSNFDPQTGVFSWSANQVGTIQLQALVSDGDDFASREFNLVVEPEPEACTASAACAEGTSCYDGRCLADPCSLVRCQDLEVCYQGACFDRCVANADCPAAEQCFDGRCSTDPCDNVQCAVDAICYEGGCFPGCADSADCRSGSSCYSGRCAPSPCAGVQCSVAETCFEGSCFPSCASDSECSGGVCSASACIPEEDDSGCQAAGGIPSIMALFLLFFVGQIRRRVRR